MAGWSHNQGWAGKFWPYTLYQYQPSWDSYAQVGTVDAWDRTISDENEDSGFPPYPQELDISGTGFLYYIDANGKHHSSDPVDASAYKAWLDPYVNGASVLLLPNLPLTEENIERLRRGV